MIIAFDGKRALQNLTGLGNYSRLIISSVASQYPADKLVVLAPADRENPRLSPIRSLSNVDFRFPLPGEAPLGKALWRSLTISRLLPSLGCDIFHGLSNELPLNIRKSGIPAVLTMHDVIYRRMPQCYSLPDRLIYDFKYGRSCRSATRIIAISECTKRDVMHFYGVPEERIDVVYQGCDDIFHKPVSCDARLEVSRVYSLPERFLLQVGSIERRKNAMLSVRALAALADRQMQLLLVGRATPYLREVLAEADALGVRERVKVLHDVPFAHLPVLYSLAYAAIYPSRYEGFGLPVLEALTCHTPCVAATGSCLEEAGGDAAIYVDPDDARSLAQAIEAIPSRRQQMIDRGAIHAARFSNDSVATNTRNVYLATIKK